MKRGIALGGGGARGAYQAGAIKALREKNMLEPFDCVSGVSVGSLNASLLSMRDYDALDALWLSNQGSKLFDKPQHMIKTLLSENVKLYDKGLYQTKRLEALIDEVIDYSLIRSSEIYVGIAHVGDEHTGLFDLIRMNIEYRLNMGEAMEYVALGDYDDATIKQTLLASCAIPIVFKPITIEGKTYFDGGILEKLPVQPLVDAGCDEIIAIDLFRFSFNHKHAQNGTRIRHIYPSKNLKGVMDFDEDLNKMRYDLGYNDTLKAIESWNTANELPTGDE